MAEVTLRRWDTVNYLKTDEEITLYLEAVLEDCSPELLAAALVDIARAKGLFVSDGSIPKGESYLEKAIESTYQRNPDGTPQTPIIPTPVSQSLNSD